MMIPNVAERLGRFSVVFQNHRPDKRALGLDDEQERAIRGIELPGLEAALEPVEVLGHPEFAVVEADLRLEK